MARVAAEAVATEVVIVVATARAVIATAAPNRSAEAATNRLNRVIKAARMSNVPSEATEARMTQIGTCRHLSSSRANRINPARKTFRYGVHPMIKSAIF